jgi:hypothetical protein
MLKIASHRYAMFAQSTFFVANVVGILFSVVYAQQTPNLYVRQKHGLIGWVSTFIALIWIAGSPVSKLLNERRDGTWKQESMADRLPSPELSNAAVEHQQGYSSYRSSSDLDGVEDDNEERGLLHQMAPARFFASKGGFRHTFDVFGVMSDILSRLILIFGFLCFTTGAVVYGGIFVSPTEPHCASFQLTGFRSEEATSSTVLHISSRAAFSFGMGF